MPAPADIDRRLPVWAMLSDLFLDTELQPADYAAMAATLRHSGYTMPELRDILDSEVTPAFASNLFSVAGAWTSWPEEAVRDIMMASLAASWRDPLGNWLKRRWLRRHIDAEWEKLASLLTSEG